LEKSKLTTPLWGNGGSVTKYIVKDSGMFISVHIRDRKAPILLDSLKKIGGVSAAYTHGDYQLVVYYAECFDKEEIIQEIRKEAYKYFSR